MPFWACYSASFSSAGPNCMAFYTVSVDWASRTTSRKPNVPFLRGHDDGCGLREQQQNAFRHHSGSQPNNGCLSVSARSTCCHAAWRRNKKKSGPVRRLV